VRRSAGYKSSSVPESTTSPSTAVSGANALVLRPTTTPSAPSVPMSQPLCLPTETPTATRT
jgi:hypothetical protein